MRMLYKLTYLVVSLIIGETVWAQGYDATDYEPPAATRQVELGEIEPFCPKPTPEWRGAQTIEGIKIAPSPVCQPDNPDDVAAFVKGTNNVSVGHLMKTRLSPDTIVKGKDLDGDGDPDEIHIRLEVVELNGSSPDGPGVIPEFSIAPGVTPGYWVFAPKTRGMSTETFVSVKANHLLRLPSPVIRVEQGDSVKITLENTHYHPHTIHLHGVDHPFVKADGGPNDGVPQTSGGLIMPGSAHTYEIQPRQPGSFVYHCHVQTDRHLLMGLIGMFVVEENRPDNWVQTFNIGAGHVRHSSVAVGEKYDGEYDMQYLDSDKELHEIIQKSTDPRVIAREINMKYDVTERDPDYFTLNGRSYPYTLRESLVVVEPNKKYKLRLFNSGDSMFFLHTHGHKMKITHYDGVEAQPAAQIMRDVVMVGMAQRLDVELSTVNDGLHSYGEGVWIFHDHNEIGVTTDGANPGGNVSAIVYQSYLGEGGMPKAVEPLDVSPYFTKEFYQRTVPPWVTTGDKAIMGALEGDEDGAGNLSMGSQETTKLLVVLLIIALFALTVMFISSKRRKQT